MTTPDKIDAAARDVCRSLFGDWYGKSFTDRIEITADILRRHFAAEPLLDAEHKSALERCRLPVSVGAAPQVVLDALDTACDAFCDSEQRWRISVRDLRKTEWRWYDGGCEWSKKPTPELYMIVGNYADHRIIPQNPDGTWSLPSTPPGEQAGGEVKCPECGSKELMFSTGGKICTVCGVLLSDKPPEPQPKHDNSNPRCTWNAGVIGDTECACEPQPADM